MTGASAQISGHQGAGGDLGPARVASSAKKQLRSRLLRGLEYTVIGAGLGTTVFVSAFITFSIAIRGNEVTVPNLIGSSLSAAGQSLNCAELNLRHEGNRFDDTVPPDFISVQDPLMGAILKKGRSVKVWTSLGPRRRIVPRIEGESLPSAQLVLEQEGFTLGRVIEVHSETYAPESIIAQDPSAYEEAGDTSEVSVLLSRGYVDDAYVMPDFISSEISYVLDRVRRGSLRISSIRYVEYSGVPRGTVVRQTPMAGTKVYKRDRIILYVSKGS